MSHLVDLGNSLSAFERFVAGEPVNQWSELMMPRHDSDGRGHNHGVTIRDVLREGSGYYGGGGGSKDGVSDTWAWTEPYNADGYGGDGSDDGGGDPPPADDSNGGGYDQHESERQEPQRRQEPQQVEKSTSVAAESAATALASTGVNLAEYSDSFYESFEETVERDDREDDEWVMQWGRRLSLTKGQAAALKTSVRKAKDKVKVETWIRQQGNVRGLTDAEVDQELQQYRQTAAMRQQASLAQEKPELSSRLYGELQDGGETAPEPDAVEEWIRQGATTKGLTKRDVERQLAEYHSAQGPPSSVEVAGGLGDRRRRPDRPEDLRRFWDASKTPDLGAIIQPDELQGVGDAKGEVVEVWRSQRPDDTTLDRRGPDATEYLDGFGAVGADATGRITGPGGSAEVLGGIGPAEAVAEFGRGDREAWIRFQGERKGLSEAAIAAAVEAASDGGEYVTTLGQDIDAPSMAQEPTINPEYAAWQEKKSIPRYVKANGEPIGKWSAIASERARLGDGTVQDLYASDGDGAVDQRTVTTPESVTVDTDSDGDGAVDQVEVRDAEGNVLSSTVHADTDGDGAVDQATVTTPEGVTVHTDSDGDGAFDQVEVRDAEGNVLSSAVHADTDGDGSVDQATVTTPEGVTVHTDRDGDGAFDQVEVRDAEGNVLSSTVHADTDGDGAVDQVEVRDAEGNVLSSTVHTDTDGDGAVDQVEVRDAEGNVLSSTVHADTDGDGSVDQTTVTTPEGVRVRTDSNGDGAFDQVEVRDAEGNVLSSAVHADTDGDGSVDQATVTTPEGVTVHTDRDGDGAFDQVEVRDAEGNVLSSTVHTDTDGDGAVDQVEVRDAEGNVLSSTVHADTDGDGAVDQTTVTTPDGVQVRTDSDGDGSFDTVEVRDAEGNVLSGTVHADTDGDGAVDQATVTTPEGVTVHTDSDGDGSFDQVEVRDAEGNVLSSTVHADTDGDGAVDQATVTTPEGVRVRTDSDGDGSFDQVEVRDAEGNVLSHTVYADTDGDGTVDQATVTTPEGTRVHNDSDGDGTFDNVPDAGSASAAVELFELNDSGSKPPGRLTREQRTGKWYNASELDDDSGINLEYVSYALMGENTIVSNGMVKIGRRDATVETTYTRNSDGTITIQSRIIGYHKDDAPGGGGGGGGGDAPLTVVSKDSNGNTAVRTAEGTTIYDSDGNYVTSLDSAGRDTDTPPATPSSLSEAIDAVQRAEGAGDTTVEALDVSVGGSVTLDKLHPPRPMIESPTADPSLSGLLQTLESGTAIDPGLARAMGLPVEVWGATVVHRMNEDGVTETALTTPVSKPIGPTTQPATGLEAEEIGDLGQAQAESRIITAYQAEQYGDPSLEGQMWVEGRDSDGSVRTGVVDVEFVEQARSYGLTPDQLFQGYVDDAESGLDGVEGVAQSQPTRSEAERFYDEVVSAYDAPDVVDDEGFATNVNAHQYTKATLEQLKSRYADDPAKTAFLDSAIKQLDVQYALHSLGTDARAGKAVAVLAEQERRNLQAQAVELGKVGTLEDIAQESGLAGTTEYRVWLADEQKYATLTGREMQDMGVSNVLHDPWSQEARDLAAQGQNVLVERTVKPAVAEVKDDPGKAAAMANFAQHMLQFAAADSGGASTVVSMMKSAEELAKESPAFAALPEAEQRKLLDHYGNPVKNPYTRAAVLAAASGMAGSIASGTAAGSSLLGQAALGVPFAAADVGGTYLDTGKVTGKDVGIALLFESLPFIPDVGSAAFKGGRHGFRSFATGGDFTDWAHGNVDRTLRINLKDLSKSIPEGFTPQGGSIADNAVFAYGSPGGLKPKTATEIQQEFGQSVQAQLFDLAADNPGKTVSVRLPDGRFITYTPPRAGALQAPGNPQVFAASPDVGFVKDGSYVTRPLPLEKIDDTPVETSQFFSPGVPLKTFRRSAAFNVAGDSGSRGPIARAVFGESSNPGVTAISKIDEAGVPNVSLSGKVYQPTFKGEPSGPPVIEVEGVRDINLPTAVPHQYGIGMPQARPGGLVTGYDQPKLLSDVQFAAGDVRHANLGGLVDQYGRFLPSGLQGRIGVRDLNQSQGEMRRVMR